MATTAVTKDTALTLVAKAIRTANMKFYVFDRAVNKEPHRYRRSFLGFQWQPYCTLHGHKQMKESAWGQFCEPCAEHQQKASAIKEDIDSMKVIESVALEARDGGDVVLDGDDIELLRRWVLREQ